MTRRLGLLALTAGACLAALIGASSALAEFPGTNGRIAWSNNPGTAGSNNDIYSIDANGANRLQLTSGPNDESDPAYSANGERIVFDVYPATTNLGQIWVMNANGTGQTQLTSGSPNDDYEPAFSPDGTKIVFSRYDGNTSQIWIMNADGTGQTALTAAGANGDESWYPQFSPDGTKIVFEHYNGATNVDGIATIAPNGTNLVQLTAPTAPNYDTDPSFSPNGARIIFSRLGGTTFQILIMNADGSGPTNLTTSTTSEYGPTFAPDGTLYLFERINAAGTGGDLFFGNPGGVNLGITPLATNLTGYNFNPTWQPLNPPACNIGTAPILTKTYGSVTVTATCTNEAASLVASGTGKAKKVSRRAVARKAKTFTIPPVTALIPKGVPTTVTLAIPKGAKKRLKKAAKAGKKGKATITATATDGLGQTSTSTIAVTFQPKKKK